MRGDPYEHAESELWHLRREQRQIIRELPWDERVRVSAFEIDEDHSIDPSFSELLLRTTADDILKRCKRELEHLRAARAADQRHRLRETVRRNGQGIVSAADRIKSAEDVPVEEFERVNGDLFDALQLCVWADRIAPDEYVDPSQK